MMRNFPTYSNDVGNFREFFYEMTFMSHDGENL
jgi:hypothetical protein